MRMLHALGWGTLLSRRGSLTYLVRGLIMASAKKIVFYSCTALLVLLFTLAGLAKLTPLVGSEVHNQMVRN